MRKINDIDVDIINQFFEFIEKTGELFWKVNRKPKIKQGDKAGSVHYKTGHMVVTLFGIQYKIHRIIWTIKTGISPKGDIDHIDGNPKNNKFENLREVSHGENMMNQKKRSTNTSGYTGVSRYKDKWKAQAQINYEKFYLGLFETKEKAHQARIEFNEKTKFHTNHGRDHIIR